MKSTQQELSKSGRGALRLSWSSVILRSVAVAVVSVFLSGPAFASASLPEALSNSRPVPAATQTGTATQAGAAQTEASQLAAREQAATNLQDYRGGEGGVYIGGSAIALVLLIVLLVILL